MGTSTSSRTRSPPSRNRSPAPRPRSPASRTRSSLGVQSSSTRHSSSPSRIQSLNVNSGFPDKPSARDSQSSSRMNLPDNPSPRRPPPPTPSSGSSMESESGISELNSAFRHSDVPPSVPRKGPHDYNRTSLPSRRPPPLVPDAQPSNDANQPILPPRPTKLISKPALETVIDNSDDEYQNTGTHGRQEWQKRGSSGRCQEGHSPLVPNKIAKMTSQNDNYNSPPASQPTQGFSTSRRLPPPVPDAQPSIDANQPILPARPAKPISKPALDVVADTSDAEYDNICSPKRPGANVTKLCLSVIYGFL